MPDSPEQIRALNATLLDTFASKNELLLFGEYVLGYPPSDEINTDQGTKYVIVELVRHVRSKGLINRLVDELNQEKPDNPTVQDYVSQYHSSSSTVTQLVATASGSSRPLYMIHRPFIDRDVLWDKAEQFFQRKWGGVLRINGPRESGKSYTTQFAKHFFPQHGTCVILDVPDVFTGKAEDVFAAFIRRFGLKQAYDKEFRLDGQDTFKAGDVANWLYNQLASELPYCCIHIDGLRQTLPKHSRELIDALAWEIKNGTQRIYLVLTDYDHELPVEIEAKLLNHRLDHLAEDDVRRHFLLHKQAGEVFDSDAAIEAAMMQIRQKYAASNGSSSRGQTGAYADATHEVLMMIKEALT